MGLVVESVAAPPLLENSYIVGSPAGDALLVDPSCDYKELVELLERSKFVPKAILCTHGHIDHVGAVARIKGDFKIPVLAHPSDRPLLERLAMQAAVLGLPMCETFEVDRWIADGDEISLGAEKGRILHTPGHSEGGVCLYFAESKILFTGDTLFMGSIGRTDFPGGSRQKIMRSIREKLFCLDEDVRFFPGHGADGTIGEERRNNPFF